MKKIYVTLLLLVVCIARLAAQSSIILPNGNVIPSMTQANRPANPTIGQLIYQTDGTSGLYVWNGTAWSAVSSGSENGTVTNVSATLPLSVTSGSTTPQISLSQANSTTNGFLSSVDWGVFNSKFSLPSLSDGSVLFSDGTTISQNNAGLKWTNSLRRLDIKGLNDGLVGSGFVNWISATIGGSGGNRVVLGVQNGDATIGAHNETLSGWSKLVINPAGATAVGSLAGLGTRMVVANESGELSSQAIPTGNIGTVTNVSAITPLSVTNTSSTPQISISQASGSSNGFLTNTDWNTFNNKQNALPNANGTSSGILTNTDWNTFNNKQNALPNASGTSSGILTNTDWNTFNNKQNALPTFTSGSILFSNGTTISQNNASLFWDNSSSKLGIGTNLPNTKLTVNTTNNGTGTSDWIAGNFGGMAGDRVVLGINEGRASLAAYNFNLSTPSILHLNPNGVVRSTNSHAVGFVSGTPTPTASFEVAKKEKNYTGSFYLNIGNGGVDGSLCNVSGYANVDNCAEAYDGSIGSYVMGSDMTLFTGRTFPTGEIIRRVEFGVYAITPYQTVSGKIEILGKINQGDLFTTLANSTFSGFGFNGINFSNTTAYKYYVVRFFDVFVTSGAGTSSMNVSPWVHEVKLYGEGYVHTYTPGGFTVTDTGTVGVNIATPANTLDVNGSIRMRNGAAPNTIMVGNSSGDASWSNTLPAHTVAGASGIKVSSTNNGTGTNDWIASSIGGTSGDRVVSGILNGKATIGGHNNALNSWSDLVINNGGGNILVGGESLTPPTTGNLATLKRPMVVNGSIRQGYYAVPVSVPAYGVTYVTWTHNLGYGPILMMSTDQNGGGNNMDYVVVTTLNNNVNESVFVLRNHGGTTANGALRWILVW